MRPGINNPPVLIRTALPVATSAGACCTTDQRGTGRYIYWVFPTSTTTAQFWRHDTWMNTWQRLADPDTFGGVARFGAGCALTHDASGPTPAAGGTANLWLFHPRSDTPFAAIQYYNEAANTWTQATQLADGFAAAGLGAMQVTGQWTTSAALVHPCTSVGSAASDDFLYIVGGNTTNAGVTATAHYRYTISTGAVAVRAAITTAADAGCQYAWLGGSPDRIVFLRGNGSNLIYRYNIAADGWVTPAPVPGTETFAVGASACANFNRNTFTILSGTRLFEFAMSPNTMTPAGTLDGGNPGAAHTGNLLAAVTVGGNKFLYVAKLLSSEHQRVQILE